MYGKYQVLEDAVGQRRTAMRMSVSSWATTDEDLERSLAATLRVAANVDTVTHRAGSVRRSAVPGEREPCAPDIRVSVCAAGGFRDSGNSPREFARGRGG